jgi:SulP family sulfate permease
MTVTVIVTLITALFGLDKMGVAVLGTVPGGMPRFSVPEIDVSMVTRLLPGSMALVFVGFMESIAIARSLADRGGYQVQPNNELIGLGLANMGAGLFSGYPVTGGLSRTAVNYESGAKTPLSSLVTAGIILLTLLFLTPLFYFLPKAVLASVIIVAVAGLVELSAWHRLFSVKFTDGSISAITFLTTLLAGIEYGILTGITSSLIVFIWNASRPEISELGYVKEERAYLNIKRYPRARTFPGILIIRVDGPFFFANTGFIKDYIRSAVALKKGVTDVIINMSGVDSADAVSLNSFGKFVGEYALRGIHFRLAEIKGAVRDLFIKARWEECCGQKIEYKSLQTVMFEILLKHENAPK